MTVEAAWRTAVKSDIVRPALAVIEQVFEFGTATLYEAAGQRGALPSAIKPVAVGFRLCGPAVTVLSPPHDNLWLHRAIYVAEPGDVLVVEVGGQYEAGYWGEIMSHAAAERKLGGIVLDGCARDGALLAEIGLPVFARGLCIRGTSKHPQGRGAINLPIRIGDAIIEAGDLVVGDTDGVVVIPRGESERVLAASRAREDKEARIIEQLAAGQSTLQLLGLD